jgi:hypothetical protein
VPAFLPSLRDLPPSSSVADEAATFLRTGFLPPSAPVSPAPSGSSSVPVVAGRRPRASASWDVATAVRMMLEGERDTAIAGQPGMPSVKTLERVRRAVSAVRADPSAEIPESWKVTPAVVQVIRAVVRTEAMP